MSYSAEISRYTPTAFLFLVDQSGSMMYKMSNGISKAQMLSDVVNHTIANLIVRCTKAEGTRDYFEIGIISYGENGVNNALEGNLSSSILNKISDFEKYPLYIEEKMEEILVGDGEKIEQKIIQPVWLKPVSYGQTPMCEAVIMAAGELIEWCNHHQDSYPPTVLNITDGVATDGDPEEILKQLSQIETKDGPVMVMNLHLSTLSNSAFQFPSTIDSLQDEFAKMLFRCSSCLPEHVRNYAQEIGYNTNSESRAFIYNADPQDLIQFFDIGTRAKQLV